MIAEISRFSKFTKTEIETKWQTYVNKMANNRDKIANGSRIKMSLFQYSYGYLIKARNPV